MAGLVGSEGGTGWKGVAAGPAGSGGGAGAGGSDGGAGPGGKGLQPGEGVGVQGTGAPASKAAKKSDGGVGAPAGPLEDHEREQAGEASDLESSVIIYPHESGRALKTLKP